jgi:integrase
LLVGDIDTGTVLKIIEPMWTTTPETASRVRARVESVLAWATVRGYRSGPNPAQWRNHLDKILPKKTKVTAVKPHNALPYQQVSAFVAALAQRPGVAAKALMLAIFTALRSNEVRGALWSEFNFADATWTIPGGPRGRMKGGKEHKVPLSKPALDLLATLPRQGDFLFPGARTSKPMTDVSLIQVIRRMGEPVLTQHGFRSTFRTWAAERTAFPEIVAEMALAHEPGTAVVKAYRRTTLFDQRRKLMEAWAAHCMTPAVVETGTVLPMRPAR